MIRKAGFGVLALGLAVVAWVGVTLMWGDPITSIYTRHEQHTLARQLDTLNRTWSATSTAELLRAAQQAKASAAKLSRAAQLRAQRSAEKAALAALLERRARQYRRSLEDGHAFGRIVIPRLHLNMAVVEGTSESDLEKGPGHYDAASGEATALPGTGETIAIAGHRTTFLHPFRHIDDLRPKDNIYLEMPYGTFRYTVYTHRVVVSTDWSILHPRRFEQLVLSACHPIYSATHRYVVFAKLTGEAGSAALAAAG
jgi:sortase A